MVLGIPHFSWWLWLFPLTYVVHILEEGFAGERFWIWIRRVPLVRSLDVHLTKSQFFVVNGLFLLAMIWLVSVASDTEYLWVPPFLGTIVAFNGLGHFFGSVILRSYSPGLISGIVLWVPLGAFALLKASAPLRPSILWASVVAGIVFHLFVILLAVLVGRSGEAA